MRSSQSILKEINPEYSLERPMLKLKFQYFGHLMQRTVSLKKTLIRGRSEGRRRKGRRRMRWLGGITDSMDTNLSKFQEGITNSMDTNLSKFQGGIIDSMDTNLSKFQGGITDSMDTNLSKFQEVVNDREVWHATVHGVGKSQTWLRNWITMSGNDNHDKFNKYPLSHVETNLWRNRQKCFPWDENS